MSMLDFTDEFSWGNIKLEFQDITKEDVLALNSCLLDIGINTGLTPFVSFDDI